MTLLWTKSKNPVDWLISLVTGEDCAHFAILFEEIHDSQGIVFESNLLGTHIAFFETWRKNRLIIHKVTVETSILVEAELWSEWVDRYDGRGYDFGGAVYLGLMKIRQRLFGIALPARNRWSRGHLYFCDEIYQLVRKVPGLPDILPDSNGMDTPHDIYLKISGGSHP